MGSVRIVLEDNMPKPVSGHQRADEYVF